MGYSLFISDLHLCESRPTIIEAFALFLKQVAADADALYILGDLFEYWAGDDAIQTGVHAQTIDALNQLSQQGVKVYLMHGNRDFLLGDVFSKATNCTILPDPSLISLHGQSILISHGDVLCTDDITYQQFRNEVRTDTWKAQFLSQPLSSRIAYIESIRAKSEQEKSTKLMGIMDVNVSAVTALLKKYNYPSTLVHGHTHRPMKHSHQINGHHCDRWVLGDWYDQGSYLRFDNQGFHEHRL
jgi:UDP-2,3-diacylglucosamine hydrolase